MKVNKSQALLLMFRLLLRKKAFSKSEVKDVLVINDHTFYRHIQELKAFIHSFEMPNVSTMI